ncbi:hypothetical protein ACLOJK_022717, partial [Asimina triloba]
IRGRHLPQHSSSAASLIRSSSSPPLPTDACRQPTSPAAPSNRPSGAILIQRRTRPIRRQGDLDDHDRPISSVAPFAHLAGDSSSSTVSNAWPTPPPKSNPTFHLGQQSPTSNSAKYLPATIRPHLNPTTNGNRLMKANHPSKQQRNGNTQTNLRSKHASQAKLATHHHAAIFPSARTPSARASRP